MQTISHYYALLLQDLNKCYYYVKRMQRNIISPRSHCNLLHHINSCDPIDNIMEKRCIQFIWNLMNSDTILFDRTVKHSLSMSSTSTTLGENIRYFMFKYGIYMSEWYGPLSVLNGKIQKHILNETIH